MRVALHKTGARVAMLRAARTSTGREIRLPAMRATSSGSMRFHGGTSTGAKRRRSVAASALRPASSSAMTRRQRPVAPSSQLRAPGGAWLRAHSHAGRSSPWARSPAAAARLASMSAGMTASATGTSSRRATVEQPPSAGESRQASSSRHQRSARRPAARQASSSSSRCCHALTGAIRHWTIPLRSRACAARSSATIAALRAAPSLSKFHVPQRSRVPAASTAAASDVGRIACDRRRRPRGRIRASRTPRARCSVSPLPVNGTTTGRAPLATTSSTVL